MDRPVRKPTRLKRYDYSAPGAYFITICTRDRRCLLSRIVSPDPSSVGAAISRPQATVCLSPVGETVRCAIENIPGIYPAVSVDTYVIMPNHIHMILRIRAENPGRLIAAPTISTVVGQMKRWCSRQSKIPLWQRSFYDHIVRGEAEYAEIAEYIENNPARWRADRFYAPA